MMNKFVSVLVLVMLVLLVGCGKEEEETAETNLDLGSGTKENLPVSLELLIHYAERSKKSTTTVEVKRMKLISPWRIMEQSQL